MRMDRDDMNALLKVAERVYASGVCPPDHKNSDQTFAVMLAGAELDLGPMQSIRCIQIVKGKLSNTAEFMVAQCLRSPVCLYFRPVETNAKQATYVTHRKGSEPVTLTYTFEQAQRAKLTDSNTWKGHTEAMLRARCAASLARAVYPDLVAGIVVPDEAEEIAREGAPASDETPRTEPKSAASAQTVDPVADYRARCVAAGSADELVAVWLSGRCRIAAEHIDLAKSVTAARAKDFGTVEEFRAAAVAAEAITKEPSHWATVADTLRALDVAATPAAVKAVADAHGAAVVKLPEGLKVRLRQATRNRQQAVVVVPPVDIAAQLEADLNAATEIPALDDVADRVEAALKAGTITADQARALTAKHNELANHMERAAEQEAA